MNAIQRDALRATVLIREQLVTAGPQPAPVHLPDYQWNEAVRLQRQIGVARYRRWHRAAARLTADLAETLQGLQRTVGWAVDGLEVRKAAVKVAPAADIYRDILSLHEEFDRVEIDVKEQTLRVTVAPITLEDVPLGRFEIVLDWRNLGKPMPYRVVALNPNPAATDNEVTHPHVRSEALCEGEGIRPIGAALAEGRVLDFFLLVSQILHNYGRGSAYVELDDWEGVSCEDCGRMVRPDERYCCSRCGVTLCGSCDIYCEHCHESYCGGCMGTCAGCQHDACRYCLAECPECKRTFCEDCRQEEGSLCHECFNKQQPAPEKPDVPQPHESQAQPPQRSPGGRSRSSRRRQAACAAAP
jgi:hypothetical protein